MADKFRIYSTDITPTLTPDLSLILPYNDTGSDNVLFVIGELITGAGGATGEVLSVTGTATTGTLIIEKTNTIAFVDTEVLTGDIAGIANVDSASGGTSPSTNIVFDQDPHYGTYTPATSGIDRGSVIKTLGGVIIQDFGVKVVDEIITFTDTDALTQSIVDALKTAYEVIDGEWYFTDGYECWRVQFSRNPRGFDSWRNLLFSEHDFYTFSYAVNLLVLSKEI